MLDSMNQRVRHAISLPNILFGVEEEELENLVDDSTRIPTPENEDKDAKKSKWYRKIPARLFQPIRKSLINLKRKNNHYELQKNECKRSESPDNGALSSLNPLPRKLSMDLSIEKNPKVFYADITSESRRPISMVEQFGEARALAQRRVTFSDILCGGYRKF